jgi:hypothetical protein
MFGNVYSKFNDIVQKNNIKLPRIDEIRQMAEPVKIQKSSLKDYIQKKKNCDGSL